jgi:pimeloyl-ACP methyl ester carboxylesterase
MSVLGLARSTLLGIAVVVAPCLAQDKYFDAAGVRLRYVEQGAGEPVVLVHGFGNTADIWTTNGIVQDLSRTYRVIAFDERGHGKSDKPHDPTRYGREMGLDVVRLLDHLGIQRAHVVGYSLGGYITSQLLTLHPERFLSATLIAGAGRFDWDDSRARLADQEASERERECISRSMLFRLAPINAPRPSEDSLKVLSAKCFADTTQDRFALAALTRSRADQAITPAATAAVTVPTLAVVGSDDPEKTPLEALVRIRPSVKLVVIDGATHAGPGGILGRPDLVATLRTFLADHRATKPPSR